MSNFANNSKNSATKLDHFIKDKFLNLSYLPRWIVFLMDIAILIVANLITFILLTNLKTNFYDTLTVIEKNVLIMVVNIAFFLICKTYTGIIRHSSTIDAIRLFFATFSSFLTLIIINYVTYFLTDKKIFLFPGLVLNFILGFAFLFFFRIFVKFIFENLYVSTVSKNTMLTIVYGSDANAIAVANAIKSENPARFKIVAFMDNTKSNTSKSILGLPILYSSKKIAAVLRGYKIKALVIADKSLSKEEKLALVDECLKNNVRVYTVPVITNWENGKSISKQIKSFEINDLLERKPIVLDNQQVSKELAKKVVMVTGAAGSIGSEIVRQVLEFKPKKLILIDQAETPLHIITLELQKVESQTVICAILSDVRNKAVLEKVFQEHRPDMVFHAAAYKHVPLMEQNPSQAIQTNILGTKNVADLAVQYKAKRFVMVSTDKAVNPSNVMGASKRIAEKYVQALHSENKVNKKHTTKFITTRFGNVLGSNGSVVPLFSKQIIAGGPITITHPDIIRYFMTIPEACQLVLEAGAMGNGGEIFIFDMGKPVKIIDLARKMIQLAGFEPDKEIAIKIIGLRPGEKLYEELLTDCSKTLPTHHEKILIAEEERGDFTQVLADINGLVVQEEPVNNLVFCMKKIVPEFKSLNSVFQELDR